MHRNKSVMAHNFSMIPQAQIKRSAFSRPHGYKTTFDSGYLIPVFFDEVLPGDSFKLRATLFARLATPIFPVMDNMYLDTFFFFVPNRLVWSHWQQFMGEQANPGDSISYLIPQMVSPAGGYAANSLQDYFGLPTAGQVSAGQTVSHASLLMRAYNLIWNQWFRDENLQNSVTVDLGDGPDTYTNYVLLRRGKRADYFTSCLPWPQKGATAVSLPLGTSAPVISNGTDPNLSLFGGSQNYPITTGNSGSTYLLRTATDLGSSNASVIWGNNSGLVTDLTNATAATINQLRLSISIQQMLERDARGGTRYTEIIRSHFGVISEDARLQRPEYLGGGSVPVNVNPIAQTSATGVTGGSSPQGNLSAMGTVLSKGNGFTKSFTEHGHVIGLISVRADLNYQQGLHRMWSRSTRYDFFDPIFANLGEQAVLQKEIYVTGTTSADNTVFGYQEHWAEYRYKPSVITGQFRSTYATPLDGWHLAQKFTSAPTLNSTYIQDTPPVNRIVAVGSGATGQQFLLDAFFDYHTARPMPTYSVPGLDKL